MARENNPDRCVTPPDQISDSIDHVSLSLTRENCVLCILNCVLQICTYKITLHCYIVYSACITDMHAGLDLYISCFVIVTTFICM